MSFYPLDDYAKSDTETVTCRSVVAACSFRSRKSSQTSALKTPDPGTATFSMIRMRTAPTSTTCGWSSRHSFEGEIVGYLTTSAHYPTLAGRCLAAFVIKPPTIMMEFRPPTILTNGSSGWKWKASTSSSFIRPRDSCGREILRTRNWPRLIVEPITTGYGSPVRVCLYLGWSERAVLTRRANTDEP